MNKEKLNNIVNVLPDAVKVFRGFIEESFEKNGQEALENANGTIGVLIKLFGKEYIQKVFDQKQQKINENYGIQTYLKAGIIQASESINEIKDANLNIDDINKLKDQINTHLSKFNSNDTIILLEPKYHPIIQLIKSLLKNIILTSTNNEQNYKVFLKHFNTHIAGTVEVTFGEENYQKHKEELKKFTLLERESEFLNDMFLLNKIGFKEEESLKYEEAYGEWKRLKYLFPTPTIYENQRNKREELFEQDSEKNLKSIEELVEEYYKSKNRIVLREILFIIADFGKGKSVFLRQLASKLAKEYATTLEGYFPVYFNLRNFANYQANVKGGVIADYLKKDYGIDIFSEEYKNRKYMFLIDSLDESGELNKGSIEDVIISVKDIQNLDTTSCRDNRVIITSRPFEDGLESQIRNHLPYTDGDDELCFLSLHGFTKEQFNDWIFVSLRDYLSENKIETNSFSKGFIKEIRQNNSVDIYKILIKNNTLTKEELKRPIFAYMIFQLIINNIDFSSIGKVGVYLSFLNLLTKEAKHISDVECNYNLLDELESRNILHSIAALWMYGRRQGKQGTLKKADIFRVLARDRIHEDDNKVIDEYANSDVNNIKFLSHSYFGAKDDLLHFQHQSFAEILLAEYYLKIFIKYSLDENIDIEEARVLLNLGEPTEQTILFFKELLQLLKDSCNENEKEKRKLLFPLLASLAIEKNNKKIRCNSLYYEWLKKVSINEYSYYPDELINNWFIDKEKLQSICNLSKLLLESKKTYLTAKITSCKALFDNEVIKIDNEDLHRIPHNLDKWLSLLVGNILFEKDIEEKDFFNSSISNPAVFFDMMSDWNYSYKTAVPHWATDFFQGIDMSNVQKEIVLHFLDINGVDFSYSKLNNISSKGSFLRGCRFDNCEFENLDLFVGIYDTTFNNIIKIENSRIDSFLDEFPLSLFCYFLPPGKSIGAVRNDKPFLSKEFDIYDKNGFETLHGEISSIQDSFNQVNGFFVYGLKLNLFNKKDIIDSYNYGSDEDKEEFIKLVEGLAE